MLLAIDVGNTNVVFALFEGRTIKSRWRIATDPRRTGDEYAVWLMQLMEIEGFARGGFTYHDVIAAQNALLATRARRVEVLKQFHIDRARLDRLTGAHADLLGLETRS